MIESDIFRGPDGYANQVATGPVLHRDPNGGWFLFCSRACLWMYYASGQRQLEPRPGVRWGCWYCGRGIEEN